MVFGVSQVMEYVEKTGKNTLDIKSLAKALGVSEASAKRYVQEAVKLGVLAPVDKGRYKIDVERAKLFMSLTKASDTKEALKNILNVIISRELAGEAGFVREKMVPLTVIVPKRYLRHVEFMLRHSIRRGELKQISNDNLPTYVLHVAKEPEY